LAQAGHRSRREGTERNGGKPPVAIGADASNARAEIEFGDPRRRVEVGDLEYRRFLALLIATATMDSFTPTAAEQNCGPHSGK
jgi:hypothetical protein